MCKKKRKSGIVSLILAMTAIFMLSACAGKAGTGTSNTGSPESSGQAVSSSTASSVPEESTMPEESVSMPAVEQSVVSAGAFEALKAEKIASLALPAGKRIDAVKAEGLVYRDENGKYGIFSIEGHDTGAVYTYCKGLDYGYFLATTSSIPEENTVETMNCLGVVDVDGNVIVPEEYASLSALDSRYIKASKATEETDSEDDALIYSTDRLVAIGPGEGDKLYKGTWCVYDTETKAEVPNAAGTKAVPVNAYGNWVDYYNDNEEKAIVNAKGELILEGSTVFRDGSYSVKTENGGEVHDTDGSLLFAYQKDGYIPGALLENGYYKASQYKDGTTRYVLLDRAGQAVSAEFTDSITPYGCLLASGGKMYDFSGQDVWGTLADSADSVTVEKVFSNCWCIRKGDSYTFVTGDGSVLCELTDDVEKGISVDAYSFCANKDKDGDTYSYCFKDGDFTIPGHYFGAFTVKARGVNDLYDLIDSISGETLIEGCDNYYQADAEEGYLVYADTGAAVDVYQIRQGA